MPAEEGVQLQKPLTSSWSSEQGLDAPAILCNNMCAAKDEASDNENSNKEIINPQTTFKRYDRNIMTEAAAGPLLCFLLNVSSTTCLYCLKSENDTEYIFSV
ncbi:uncharacterized protein LOC120354528 [Nilaparvata lugens]|uniref:uncharacterized protein LOC120354528 n=1 Tax=Nilaparvata lugens TaxID=108931 RepID=UPI00193CD016|nr:uncharacterized protein LOC120354528 [Nilaparvata lugens]